MKFNLQTIRVFRFLGYKYNLINTLMKFQNNYLMKIQSNINYILSLKDNLIRKAKILKSGVIIPKNEWNKQIYLILG